MSHMKNLTAQETIRGIDDWKPQSERIPTWEEVYKGFETNGSEFAFNYLQGALVTASHLYFLTAERQLDILERSVKECKRQIAMNRDVESIC